MTVSTRTETWRSPLVARYPDGRGVAMERDVVSVSDIRETPLGPIDPPARPWWRFW